MDGELYPTCKTGKLKIGSGLLTDNGKCKSRYTPLANVGMVKTPSQATKKPFETISHDFLHRKRAGVGICFDVKRNVSLAYV